MKKDFHTVSRWLHQMAFPHISCYQALGFCNCLLHVAWERIYPSQFSWASCMVHRAQGSNFTMSSSGSFCTENLFSVAGRSISSRTAEIALCVSKGVLGCHGIPQRGPQSPSSYIHSASSANTLLQRMRCFSQSLWYSKKMISQPTSLQRSFYLLATNPSFQKYFN